MATVGSTVAVPRIALYYIVNENKTILPYDLYKLFINWSGDDISGIKKGKDIY